MSKPIFTALAPNTQWDDVWLSMRLLLQPWRWSGGATIAQLEARFRSWLPIKHAFSFSSGRAGLFAILQSLDLKASDEVLLQAYTCVAVPDPILWAGARPIYVDCEADTFNISPSNLESKITPKSRVLIIQYTFGRPADLSVLLAIAKKHGLFVIEDCAHALGATYNNQRVGTLGNAAFFSFGRDKVISSVFGGVVVTNDSALSKRIAGIQQAWKYPSWLWTIQQLLHPIVTAKAKLCWRIFGLGKLIMAGSKIFHLTSKAVYGIEKRGGCPDFVKHKMPNALAQLALHQFAKLEKFNAHRRKIAKIYSDQLTPSPNLRLPSPEGVEDGPSGCRPRRGEDESIYLRYTIRTPHATRILKEARKQNIYLGDWYQTPIAPAGVDYAALSYQPGSCPVAEKLAAESLNLPTDIHITEKDAARIVKFISR